MIRRPSGTFLLVLPWELSALGGVNRVVGDLYHQLDVGGQFHPRVVVLDWSARRPVERIDVGEIRSIRMRVRPPFGAGNLPIQFCSYGVRALSEMRGLAAVIRQFDVRVVNCHFIGESSLAWVLAKALGIFRGKLLFSVHGADVRRIAELRGARRAIWRAALERVDAFIACSQALAEESVSELALSGSNVVTIRNGVDVARLGALDFGPRRANGEERRRHLVNLGTFEHKKGHDVLLRAFATVRERFRDVHLSIAGRAGGALDATRALVKELRLEDHVSLVVDAPHREALSLLKSADIFVMPSRREPFSIAMLEAGAMAKPMVATSVCGVVHEGVIVDRVTGVVVAPDDVEALARGIGHFLENETAALACGQKLQERISKDFTVQAVYRQYIDVVERAVAS